MEEPVRVAIRHGFTGELLCEWARSEVGERRVWELRLEFCQEHETPRFLEGYSSMRNELWMTQLSSRNIGMTHCREASCSLLWCGSFAHRHREKYWPLRTASNYGIEVISGQFWPKGFQCPHSCDAGDRLGIYIGQSDHGGLPIHI